MKRLQFYCGYTLYNGVGEVADVSRRLQVQAFCNKLGKVTTFYLMDWMVKGLSNRTIATEKVESKLTIYFKNEI